MIQCIISILFVLLSIPSFSVTPINSWSPPAIIDPTSSVTALQDVFTSSDPFTGRFLATWPDSTTSFPTYSIYTPNSGWSAPAYIDTSLSILDVYTIFNPVTKQFFAVWGNNTEVRYSVLVNDSWSPSQSFVLNPIQSYPTIPISVSSVTGQVLAIEGAPDVPPYPAYYSLYDPFSNTWSAPKLLANLIDYDVFSSFDPTTNRFLATWGNVTPGIPAVFSFYDPNTDTWSAPQEISMGSSVSYDVNNSIDPTTGQCLAMWGDLSTPTLMYSFYDPNTQQWSAAQVLGNLDLANQSSASVGIAVDPSLHQWLATWVSPGTVNLPLYSFYTKGVGWSAPAAIDATSTFEWTSALCSFGPFTRQYLATWADISQLSAPSVYSFFTLPPLPPPGPNAQLTMKGKQRKNNFEVASEYFNQLNWSITTTSEVVEYLLYRNGSLIATLPGNATSYQDHNQPKTTQLYLLVAKIAEGQQASTSTLVGPQ